MQEIEKWAEENGISGDFASLCENQKVKEYILGELSKTAKEKKVFSCLAFLHPSFKYAVSFDSDR